MSALHVHQDLAPFDAHAVGRSIGAFHILFVLVFDKGVAPGFALVRDNFEILDRAKGFHFPQQFAFRNLVGETPNEKCIVAIHPFELSTTLALLLAIFGNDRLQFLPELLQLELFALFLERSRCWQDGAFGRASGFKFFQIRGHARPILSAAVGDGRHGFQWWIRHKGRANIGRQQHDGWARIGTPGGLTSRRCLPDSTHTSLANSTTIRSSLRD